MNFLEAEPMTLELYAPSSIVWAIYLSSWKHTLHFQKSYFLHFCLSPSIRKNEKGCCKTGGCWVMMNLWLHDVIHSECIEFWTCPPDPHLSHGTRQINFQDTHTHTHYLLIFGISLSLNAWHVWNTVVTVNADWTQRTHTWLDLFYIYIYIYAFSRRFYPKRLTVHSGYRCSVSVCVPWESNPQSFALLTQCSNHWATQEQVLPWPAKSTVNYCYTVFCVLCQPEFKLGFV